MRARFDKSEQCGFDGGQHDKRTIYFVDAAIKCIDILLVVLL